MVAVTAVTTTLARGRRGRGRGGRWAPGASSRRRGVLGRSRRRPQLCRRTAVSRYSDDERAPPRTSQCARLDGRGPRPGAARDVRRARADGVSRARAEAGDATPTLRGLDVVRVARGGGRRRARGGVLAARGHLELEEQRAEARRARGVIGVLLRAGGPAHVERVGLGGGDFERRRRRRRRRRPPPKPTTRRESRTPSPTTARWSAREPLAAGPPTHRRRPARTIRCRARRGGRRRASLEARRPRGAPDAPARATSRRASRAAPRTSSARIRERATRGSARDAIDARHQHVLNTPTIVVSHEENPENLVSSGKKINPRLSSPSPRRFPTNLRADSGAPFRRTSREI